MLHRGSGLHVLNTILYTCTLTPGLKRESFAHPTAASCYNQTYKTRTAQKLIHTSYMRHDSSRINPIGPTNVTEWVSNSAVHWSIYKYINVRWHGLMPLATRCHNPQGVLSHGVLLPPYHRVCTESSHGHRGVPQDVVHVCGESCRHSPCMPWFTVIESRPPAYGLQMHDRSAPLYPLLSCSSAHQLITAHQLLAAQQLLRDERWVRHSTLDSPERTSRCVASPPRPHANCREGRRHEFPAHFGAPASRASGRCP